MATGTKFHRKMVAAMKKIGWHTWTVWSWHREVHTAVRVSPDGVAVDTRQDGPGLLLSTDERLDGQVHTKGVK